MEIEKHDVVLVKSANVMATVNQVSAHAVVLDFPVQGETVFGKADVELVMQ